MRAGIGLLLALVALAACNTTATAQTGPVVVNGAPNSTTMATVQGNTASAEGARPTTTITAPVALAPGSNAATGNLSTTSAPVADAGTDAR